MLWPDPAQKARLTEIIANLRERIAEARANGWRGEVQGLQVSLEAATVKMTNLVRAEQNRGNGRADLGIPTIREV